MTMRMSPLGDVTQPLTFLCGKCLLENSKALYSSRKDSDSVIDQRGANILIFEYSFVPNTSEETGENFAVLRECRNCQLRIYNVCLCLRQSL